MKSLAKHVAVVIGLGPALFLLGHLYLYSAEVGAGHWLGPWTSHPAAIMAVGAVGLVMVALATLSLASVTCISAFDRRSSRALAEGGRLRLFEGLSLALSQTPLGRSVADSDADAATLRNRMEWGAFLLGLPSATSAIILFGVDAPMATALLVGALTALVALGFMSVRLRHGAFRAPILDVMFLGIAQLHAVVLASYLYASIQSWLFPVLGLATLGSPAWVLGVAILCCAFVALLLLPGTRASAQRRLIVLGLGVTLLSLLPSHALRVISTALTYTAGSQARGVLVAKSGTFSVPNACPAAGCDTLENVQLIADLGQDFVFWYQIPTSDGHYTSHRATVSADAVHFEIRQRPTLKLSDWELFL